jgi:3-oxoacyl-[acyl-carrier-protein] synthase II
MTRRPVYVIGAGAVSPLGASWPATAAALARGDSAVRPVAHFDTEGFPCRVAAWIDADSATPGRRVELALAAAREAWRQARPLVSVERIGVFVGAESGRATFQTCAELVRAAGGAGGFDHVRFGAEGRALAAVVAPELTSPAAVASRLAAEIGAAGPVSTVSLACASGAAAIAEAARAVRSGECDVALAGGVGADVDPLMLVSFGLLGALSVRGVSCPFDARRDGFVVGEGAAMVVLGARKGAARVEVAGVGRSLDAHHLTAPDPEGSGAERAMRAAIADGGDEDGVIGYVQAHGTSTALNDAVEAAAIRRVLGEAVEVARVSSVKGALGHWIAGAGAIGFLAAAHTVAERVALPTAGLREPDPTCELPHVIGAAVEHDCRRALVNSFAFGGANVSLLLRRVEA